MNVELLAQTVGCIRELSIQEFACVISGLGVLLQDMIKVCYLKLKAGQHELGMGQSSLGMGQGRLGMGLLPCHVIHL